MNAQDRDAAPTFANTGVLSHHDLGCRCWPHVSERDALDAIAAVALAEYRDGLARLSRESTPEPDAAPSSPALDRHGLAARIMAALNEHGASYRLPRDPSDLAHLVADALARTEGDTPFAAAPACDRTHWEQVIEDAKAGLCACGHEPDEHVHYCSHELDSGSCPCEVEYVTASPESLDVERTVADLAGRLLDNYDLLVSNGWVVNPMPNQAAVRDWIATRLAKEGTA